MKQHHNPAQTVLIGIVARKFGTVACAVGLMCWNVPATAEEEARSADTAAARELAIEGLKLADAGNCSEAVDKLARAEKLHHAPIVLGRLGECEIATGKLVDGTENLRRLLREPVPSDSPPALMKARERAQTALDAAKPKIASLVISVKEPTEGVTVTVDGQPVQSALFDRGRPTDPGEHVVEATAPGYLKSTRQVTLGPGEKQELALRLAVDPNATVREPEQKVGGGTALPARQTKPLSRSERREPVDAPVADDATAHEPSYAPSYVLWSVGGAAVGVGGVFGYLALKNKQDIEKQCVNNVCDPSTQGQLDTAKRDALLSTVLMAGGGAVVAVGTVVYLMSGPSNEKSTSASSGMTASPVIGLGQVGLRGTF